MRIGVIGTGRIVSRFISEVETVNNVSVAAIYNPHIESVLFFAEKNNIEGTADLDTALEAKALESNKILFTDIKEDMYKVCDAIYVASPHEYHVSDMKDAINAGKHVLCEKPFALSGDEALSVFELARKKASAI